MGSGVSQKRSGWVGQAEGEGQRRGRARRESVVQESSTRTLPLPLLPLRFHTSILEHGTSSHYVCPDRRLSDTGGVRKKVAWVKGADLRFPRCLDHLLTAHTSFSPLPTLSTPTLPLASCNLGPAAPASSRHLAFPCRPPCDSHSSCPSSQRSSCRRSRRPCSPSTTEQSSQRFRSSSPACPSTSSSTRTRNERFRALSAGRRTRDCSGAKLPLSCVPSLS